MLVDREPIPRRIACFDINDWLNTDADPGGVLAGYDRAHARTHRARRSWAAARQAWATEHGYQLHELDTARAVYTGSADRRIRTAAARLRLADPVPTPPTTVARP